MVGGVAREQVAVVVAALDRSGDGKLDVRELDRALQQAHRPARADLPRESPPSAIERPRLAPSTPAPLDAFDAEGSALFGVVRALGS